jgi:hypothetical protein
MISRVITRALQISRAHEIVRTLEIARGRPIIRDRPSARDRSSARASPERLEIARAQERVVEVKLQGKGD